MATTTCAVEGGCPTDYIALAIAALFFLLLLSRSICPCIVRKAPRINGSGFWIPVIQVFASFNLLLSIVMSDNFLPLKKRHWWQSCYVWAVWVEGPFGFGLLLSCRVAQAFQLYNIFVKRRLPPIKSYIFLSVILVPWIAGAAFMQVKKPLNDRCHMGIVWIIPVLCLHTLYITALFAFTRAIRHIEFRFNELRDLWKGILVSASSIGVWVSAYVLNEIHDDVSWLQAASRCILLITAGILVLVFFSISSSQPLLSQISLKKKETSEFETMGQALGIPDSGLLIQKEPTRIMDPSEPLINLLLNKRFRESFMAFADSCYAGESVHFYEELHELEKIPEDDRVKRIYMARHIIEKYIVAGAEMETNISHQTRQEILTTNDLSHPKLFNNALNELMQLMKTNLARDYWSSMFFMKLKEDISARPNGFELEHMTRWSFSPRLSLVHDVNDPFNNDCRDGDPQ